MIIYQKRLSPRESIISQPAYPDLTLAIARYRQAPARRDLNQQDPSFQEKVKLKPKAMPKQKEDKDQEPEIPDVHFEGLRPTDDGIVFDSEDIAAKILVHVTDKKTLKKIIEEGQPTPGITRHVTSKEGLRTILSTTDFVRSNKPRDFPMNQLRPESPSASPITISHYGIFTYHWCKCTTLTESDLQKPQVHGSCPW